jgi:hypothetical protein
MIKTQTTISIVNVNVCKEIGFYPDVNKNCILEGAG